MAGGHECDWTKVWTSSMSHYSWSLESQRHPPDIQWHCSSSSSRASPGLERSRFHELPQSSSILGVSPRWVQSVVGRLKADSLVNVFVLAKTRFSFFVFHHMIYCCTNCTISDNKYSGGPLCGPCPASSRWPRPSRRRRTGSARRRCWVSCWCPPWKTRPWSGCPRTGTRCASLRRRLSAATAHGPPATSCACLFASQNLTAELQSIVYYAKGSTPDIQHTHKIIQNTTRKVENKKKQ